MSRTDHSRRLFLTRSAALGCSLAASPLMTPVTMASAPWDNRLVVIILRGGLDGLDAVRPYGAREFAAYRDGMAGDDVPGELDLDGFFALHPAMAPLMPLWRAGQLGFAHAVSTPYRDKRSHFDGQDILEAGSGASGPTGRRDGWLNRMLQTVPGTESETAYAIGQSDMLLTRGAAEVADWSPDAALTLSPQAQRLLEMVMHEDPLFRDAMQEAVDLSQESLASLTEDGPLDTAGMMDAMQDSMRAPRRKGGGTGEIAQFAAERLRGDTRIAAYSISGFDTHARQHRTLPRALGTLTDNILALRDGLGPVWDKTSIIAMTEFGRTARANGTGGTDHGTGGVMMMAGGALRGGRIVTDWPGLTEAELYRRRDLMPTRDVRAHAGWIMHHLLGLDRRVIEQTVFPGLDLGVDPGLIL
ncbi:DUF1501 domain-containing protein [Roseovarius salis]|uniref:DUF1501 domain-containing protein n=1 Tax=Roseovarius salis TaxID=3376063 RepID=UPI0037CB77D6